MNDQIHSWKRVSAIKDAALYRAKSLDPVVLLDSKQHSLDPYGKYEWIFAAGARNMMRVEDGDQSDPFETLTKFRRSGTGWLFGYLSYDVKNSIENLRSDNQEYHRFSELMFFEPQFLILCKAKESGYVLEPIGEESFRLLEELTSDHSNPIITPKANLLEIEIPGPEGYRKSFNRIRAYIQRGDIYEANYCLNFKCKAHGFNPYAAFDALGQISPMPFSCFLRDRSEYLLSASPERFLVKRGTQLFSQPMKGTTRRSSDPKQDFENRSDLADSEKERSENIMITDLVRNDLGKSAIVGSVKVEKLCDIVPFPRVWQMISTVSCTIDPEIDPIEVIRNAFPMGSMTGAPKIRAMQIIDESEDFRRGIFSGSVGYIDPKGDFDFNVVIRSLIYSGDSANLSFPAGSAITFDASPEEEYRECLVKASSMYQAITGKALPIP